MPLMSLHAIILQEMLEGGLHVRQMRQDGSIGEELTKEIIRVRRTHARVYMYIYIYIYIYIYMKRYMFMHIYRGLFAHEGGQRRLVCL
jgi:hypothetical protein